MINLTRFMDINLIHQLIIANERESSRVITLFFVVVVYVFFLPKVGMDAHYNA